MTDNTPPRAGRPMDETKTFDILNAARECFFSDGFAETSIEKIARQAGVSKVTIYNRFGDKPGLLEGLVRRQADMMTIAISQMNRDAPDLRTRLANFGTTLLGFLFHETHFHFDAILATEAKRHPDMTRRFFEAGPGTMRRELAKILVEGAEAGDLDIDDGQTAAEDLVSLWKGFPEVELRFGVSEPNDNRRIERCVEHGLDVFFRAYSARS